MREHLRKEGGPRMLVWDPLEEYGEFTTRTVTKPGDLARAVNAKSFRVSYFPGHDPAKFGPQFGMFCRIAFEAGNLLMLVEELADVTKPSFAPLSWRQCTKKGRHAGLRIIAASQRPADVDKHYLSGLTYARCFTLRFPEDRKAMAGAMNVPVADIAALRTVETEKGVVLNWIEADFRTGVTQSGSKTIRKK